MIWGFLGGLVCGALLAMRWSRYRQKTKLADPEGAFQAIELVEGALAGHSGEIAYSPEFNDL